MAGQYDSDSPRADFVKWQAQLAACARAALDNDKERMPGWPRTEEGSSLNDGEFRLRGCGRRVEAYTHARWHSVPAAYAPRARLGPIVGIYWTARLI